MFQIVRKSLVAVVAVLACVMVLWGALFIHIRSSEGCFLGYSDQRLIDAAIQYEISAGKRHVDLLSEADLIHYPTIQEFKDRNKDCCTIDRSQFEVTHTLDRAIGATEVSVSFWYRAATSGSEPFYFSYVVMNACGKTLASHGITTAEGPKGK